MFYYPAINLNFFFRHAGLDPASRGSWKNWIPAFAGMTSLSETAIKIQALSKTLRHIVSGCRRSRAMHWKCDQIHALVEVYQVREWDL
jgi:hypothetical protein